MIPIKHPHCNDVLKRPHGMTEEECRDLHIRREDGNVCSFWKPNDEELLALNRGGSVALIVMGETHPPLSVMAARPTEPFDRIPTEAEYRHRMGAVNGRISALMVLTKNIVAEWVLSSGHSHERQHLVNQFLDLININRADGEIVDGMPQPEPEQTTTATDAERYRADAEGWKAEAERCQAELKRIGEVLECDWRPMAFPEVITALKSRMANAEQELARRIDPAVVREQIKVIRGECVRGITSIDKVLALPELNPNPEQS